MDKRLSAFLTFSIIILQIEFEKVISRVSLCSSYFLAFDDYFTYIEYLYRGFWWDSDHH